MAALGRDLLAALAGGGRSREQPDGAAQEPAARTQVVLDALQVPAPRQHAGAQQAKDGISQVLSALVDLQAAFETASPHGGSSSGGRASGSGGASSARPLFLPPALQGPLAHALLQLFVLRFPSDVDRAQAFIVLKRLATAGVLAPPSDGGGGAFAAGLLSAVLAAWERGVPQSAALDLRAALGQAALVIVGNASKPCLFACLLACLRLKGWGTGQCEGLAAGPSIHACMQLGQPGL